MRSEGIDMVTVINSKAVPSMLAQAIIDIDGVCSCGAPLEFNSSLSEVRCSSLDCRSKKIAEAKRALLFLGVTEEELVSIESEIDREITDNSKCGCEILLSSEASSYA